MQQIFLTGPIAGRSDAVAVIEANQQRAKDRETNKQDRHFNPADHFRLLETFARGLFARPEFRAVWFVLVAGLPFWHDGWRIAAPSGT